MVVVVVVMVMVVSSGAAANISAAAVHVLAAVWPKIHQYVKLRRCIFFLFTLKEHLLRDKKIRKKKKSHLSPDHIIFM